jgi:hypothetical protein
MTANGSAIYNELALLTGDVHSSITHFDDFFYLFPAVLEDFRIEKRFPQLSSGNRYTGLREVIDRIKPDSGVNCLDLARSFAYLVAECLGDAAILKIVPPFLSPPYSYLCPSRFEHTKIDFGEHYCCYEPKKRIVYDPQLLPAPVALNQEGYFGQYLRQAFSNVFLPRIQVLKCSAVL